MGSFYSLPFFTYLFYMYQQIFLLVVISFPPYVTELHGSPLKLALTHLSDKVFLYHLAFRLLLLLLFYIFKKKIGHQDRCSGTHL